MPILSASVFLSAVVQKYQNEIASRGGIEFRLKQDFQSQKSVGSSE